MRSSLSHSSSTAYADAGPRAAEHGDRLAQIVLEAGRELELDGRTHAAKLAGVRTGGKPDDRSSDRRAREDGPSCGQGLSSPPNRRTA